VCLIPRLENQAALGSASTVRACFTRRPNVIWHALKLPPDCKSPLPIVGKHDQAISEFTKAINLDPENANNAAVYVSHGISYTKMGEYDKAIADFTKSIELKPDNDQAYLGRRIACAFKGESYKAGCWKKLLWWPSSSGCCRISI
jgi:tetratricopeptide (TPR) repeat protein